MTIIHSLKLIFNPLTVISVLTGMINNGILVLLVGYLYTKWNNTLSKTLYFLSYFLTIFILYSDTIYFFITSTHIKKIVFANLNYYSIASVIYTTDKSVLLGISISFFFLLLLFRTPKKSAYLHTKNIGGMIVTICLLANVINISAAYTYPQLLLADGFDDEAEIEKSRNLSRDMLSDSVTISLARELWQKDQEYVPAANQLQHFPFSDDEIDLLSQLEIDLNKKPSSFQRVFLYEKIIVIVAESFHRDYLHFYNSQIPAETTPFFDSLLTKYPHSDHYYPSNTPTTQGLNSMFLSQVLYSDEQSFENNATIFRTLEGNGYQTMFLEATSQYYNDEFHVYKKRFGMNLYKAQEDLERQGYIGSSGWGFHNDVMYEETIQILEKNRNNKLFLVTKTIDLHQPYPYCGLSKEDIPAAINNEELKNLYLKSIYWEDFTLQNFFQDLEKRKLLDDKTLIIVTSDHNPHPSQNRNYKRLGEKDLGIPLAPIPLIFISTNLEPFNNFSSATFASQIDFAPTLLGILGIPSPPQFSGRNMLTVPPERSYAISSSGDTIYYRAKDRQLKTDIYTEKDQNDFEKALVHWVEDLYVSYFLSDSAKEIQ